MHSPLDLKSCFLAWVGSRCALLVQSHPNNLEVVSLPECLFTVRRQTVVSCDRIIPHGKKDLSLIIISYNILVL